MFTLTFLLVLAGVTMADVASRISMVPTSLVRVPVPVRRSSAGTPEILRCSI